MTYGVATGPDPVAPAVKRVAGNKSPRRDMATGPDSVVPAVNSCFSGKPFKANVI